jgi:hypothetical protein
MRISVEIENITKRNDKWILVENFLVFVMWSRYMGDVHE